MSDSADVCILRCISFSKICTEQGATGPKRKPEKATAMESPKMEGVNQIRSSRTNAWGETVSKLGVIERVSDLLQL
jgi:hypothetical protein